MGRHRRHQNLRRVNGILLLDKPPGLTSNAALQVVKKMFAARKAGHTGSLDPLATGLLPLCFGEATKISGFLLDADKDYRVTCKFGERTTTGDAEGEVISQRLQLGNVVRYRDAHHLNAAQSQTARWGSCAQEDGLYTPLRLIFPAMHCRRDIKNQSY